MSRFTVALGIGLSLLPAYARHDVIPCGTHGRKTSEEYQLHRQSARSGIKRLRNAAVPAVRADVGNIAILNDTDGVVARRNPFDLNQTTLRFVPASAGAGSFRYETGPESYDAAAALSGSPLEGLGDDDTRRTALPFLFPYFGKTYSEIYINSDGNVSFGEGDGGVTDRSLGRFLAGVPRIAAAFEDLDPSQAKNGGGTFVTASASRFVVSWVRVPEYSDFGTGRAQTFQIRLFRDGLIEIAWNDVAAQDAIVGLSKGGPPGDVSLVNFSTASAADYSTTVAERFAGTETVDIFAAAQRFYLNHEDSYDYLVFFNNLGVQADPGQALAFEVTVRNSRTGYGDRLVDVGTDAGSPKRLQSLLNMGSFGDYPRDVNARILLRSPSPDTPRTILAHEAGHLFLAYASVRDEEGPVELPMLGNGGAHWSPTFNSEASLLEGERIRDNGADANPRFTTVAAVESYSPLDQYLMGFRAPEEVPDTFFVASASSGAPRFLPAVGVAFHGRRRNVTLDEVISEVGRRTPDHTVAQRRFRFAFVLITAAGQEPSADDLARMEDYRQAFEKFYGEAASQRAVADATLKRSLTISSWPAIGLMSGGGSVAVRITTEKPVESSLTLLLRNTTGAAETIPSAVTIPAGRTETTFSVRGLRPGADTILLEPSDSRYESAELKTGVSTASMRTLRVLAGEGQGAVTGVVLNEPIRIKLLDINGLPYPGVALTATVEGGGSVDAANKVTDENGIASFRWTPGSGSVQELRIGDVAVTTVIVTALAKPAIAGGGLVNAASFAPGLVPGGIATIFGSSLGASAPASVQVLVNGLPSQVFFSSAGQVNFLVPEGVPAGSMAEVLVTNAGGKSEVSRVAVQDAQPGIFYDPGSGYGAILVAGTGLGTQVRPAQRGEVLEIYATGLGLTSPGPGGLRETRLSPAVTVGGAVAEVLFSGLAPGFPGLYQINARLPGGAAAGTQPLLVTISGRRSNEVRIEVR